MRSWNALLVFVVALAVTPAYAQRAVDPARAAPGHTCTATISGAGGITVGAAEQYKSLPTLIMHGAKDSIVPPATSRRAVAALQAVGAPHIYLEFPDKDHEFWIRRGAAQMEKVFLFFSLVSKRTTVLPQK
jgi:alpha-beta hydrolase superfamily lysophospholipase